MSEDKTYYEKIDNFFGGISDDIRQQLLQNFAITQHFDIWTNPKRLTPYRLMEPDENTAFLISMFVYGLRTLFGVGRKGSSDTTVKLYQKTLGSTISSSWAACTNGEDSETNPGGNTAALMYHNYVYGGKRTGIWAWGSYGGSPTFTSAARAVSSVEANGIVTSDDLLLMPTLDTIQVKNGAGSGPTDAWSDGLSAGVGRFFGDLCELGDLVACAAYPSGNYDGAYGSKVMLWDKVNDDPQQVIDWGEGYLYILENLGGTLVGVSQVSRADEGGIRDKIVVRTWSGGSKAETIFELEDDGATLRLQPNYTKIKDSSQFSFGIKITINGVTYFQMATVGRKSVKYPLSFTLGRLVDNTTAITQMDGAVRVGNTYYIAHNGDGSVNRTDDAANFTTATYISQKLNGESKVQDSARRNKVLVMAGVVCPPLPTGATISLYYRTDSNSSWVLIRTYSTTNGMGFEAGAADGPADFINYKEAQFKAESTGGAEIEMIVWAWKFAGTDVTP